MDAEQETKARFLLTLNGYEIDDNPAVAFAVDVERTERHYIRPPFSRERSPAGGAVFLSCYEAVKYFQYFDDNLRYE